jgi:PPOX class probable F420-dependent enzyme
MADYGVTSDLDGALPWSWARERLVRCRNYWVVTVNAHGQPHSMPVWGVWDATADTFWFSCSPNARKAKNLAANPRMTVTTDDSVEVVSVQGRASITPPAPERSAAITAYAAKYAEGDELNEAVAAMEAFVESHAVFRMAPTAGYGIIEREADFAEKATRWRWPAAG